MSSRTARVLDFSATRSNVLFGSASSSGRRGTMLRGTLRKSATPSRSASTHDSTSRTATRIWSLSGRAVEPSQSRMSRAGRRVKISEKDYIVQLGELDIFCYISTHTPVPALYVEKPGGGIYPNASENPSENGLAESIFGISKHADHLLKERQLGDHPCVLRSHTGKNDLANRQASVNGI